MEWAAGPDLPPVGDEPLAENSVLSRKETLKKVFLRGGLIPIYAL